MLYVEVTFLATEIRGKRVILRKGLRGVGCEKGKGIMEGSDFFRGH